MIRTCPQSAVALAQYVLSSLAHPSASRHLTQQALTMANSGMDATQYPDSNGEDTNQPMEAGNHDDAVQPPPGGTSTKRRPSEHA